VRMSAFGEIKKPRRKQLRSISMWYPGICLNGQRKTMINLSGQLVFRLAFKPGTFWVQVRGISTWVSLFSMFFMRWKREKFLLLPRIETQSRCS
jgi:hypothetical protein